jgi:cysteine desulfurase/selenocysteine lyase
MIYFDNAATSFPKPESTIRAMNRFMTESGGSPGRSGHRLSIAAARTVFEAREAVAGLLGIPDPLEIAFTKNATEALNIAVFGLLKPGDHAITSAMEHNSVMRPLRALQAAGVELSIIPCSRTGELDPGDVVPLIRTNTKAVFLTHASNITGTIMPVGEVGRIAAERGVTFCVDAAQTAGALPIDVASMHIDLLAFTGHKSLFGPQGTGGLYVREGLETKIRMLMRGGTGSGSESEEQPEFMPDRFEAGTINAVGLAGLSAGAAYVAAEGVRKIRSHEQHLTRLFLEGIRDNGKITVYGPADPEKQMPIVSFAIRGIDPGRAALMLDEEFDILSRPGLHCAPAAHRTTGSFPTGTVRFSFGCFNTEEEIRRGIDALSELSAGV